VYFIGNIEHRELNCSDPLEWKPQTDIISVAWSKSIKGPWHSKVVLDSASPNTNQTAWDCHNSNPAPLVLPNGTVLLMFRGTACDRVGSGCGKQSPNTCEKQGIAVADHWNASYVKRPEHITLTPGGFEDAFFWRSSLGFHALFHSKAVCGDARSDVCGAYAWSTDSYEWHSSPEQVYGGEVQWADGSRTKLNSRQRPQLVFSQAGTADPVPIALFNGVSTDGNSTWTMAQAFNA
jgi:hypothetical protein